MTEKGGETSRLEQRLAAGLFTITAELVPPLSSDPAELLARAAPLKGLAAAVNVTDGAGARVHLSSLVAAGLIAREGIEPILQMTCRDRNRLALQGDLLGALALGIRNLLIISGDDPKTGDQPEAKPVFDLDSRGLLSLAQQVSQQGRLPTGAAVKGPTRLFLGAAALPIDPPRDWPAADLIDKADRGARFVQTQFCMDAGLTRRWVGRLRELGVTERLGILIGVAPIPSARSARWMREKLYGTIIPDALVGRLERAGDPRREGLDICVELLHELAEIPGVAGAHIMAPQNPAAIPETIEMFSSACERRR
ncbi:MAG TPA: methylenetetrahydrofolate reductase [Stellaceae bacterium]|nr:methylenetetrahydrofolate reductase [Stellaceae bacterium]